MPRPAMEESMNVNGKSDRGQSPVADSVTVSAARVDAAEPQGGDCLAIRSLNQPATHRATASPPTRGYVAPMGKSITAHTALAAIDEHRPNLPTIKKHLLLF